MNIKQIFEYENLEPYPVNVRELVKKYDFYYVDGIIATGNIPETIKRAIREGAEWIHIPVGLVDINFVEDIALNIRHIKATYKLV